MLSLREIVSKEMERNYIFSDFSLILNVFSMSWRLYIYKIKKYYCSKAITLRFLISWQKKEKIPLMVWWILVSFTLQRLKNTYNTDIFQKIILHSTTKGKEIISTSLEGSFLKSKFCRLTISCLFCFILVMYGNGFIFCSRKLVS